MLATTPRTCQEYFPELHPARHPRPRRAVFILAVLALAAGLVLPSTASAFCGFYVAKADTELFNRASKVVLVRDGERTVITMANDFRGDPKEFAIVIPVPVVLERGQIHVGDRAVLDHLDAYSAPRLVEYHDPDPCMRRFVREKAVMMSESAPSAPAPGASAKSLGVTIEAEYTVGEYDIVLLSAKESDGLETWLRGNGYRIPEGASDALTSYIRQGMRFFVAKVNLQEQAKLGYTYLRPLQIAFEWERFSLPIRLGTVNADGPQELFVFALTRTGRVETSNYRTVNLPSDVEIPAFVAEDFGDFYRAMFDRAVEKERMRTVFLEYAWDMNWCDPCAADPLSHEELRQLGVFWAGKPQPQPRPTRQGAPRFAPTPGPARDVYITRLHMRYTAETFPDDLMFRETGDRTNFQGRYILHRPWTGSPSACSEAQQYFVMLAKRQEQWAQNLASLTGWELAEIQSRMDIGERPVPAKDDVPWWKKLWGGDEEDGR